MNSSNSSEDWYQPSIKKFKISEILYKKFSGKPTRIGRGGFGLIYKTECNSIGTVAIKEITIGIEDDEICNVELWGTEFYPEGRDCIIPVHNILSRFVPIKYKISDRKNVREYLAVNPVNRKFNIR